MVYFPVKKLYQKHHKTHQPLRQKVLSEFNYTAQKKISLCKKTEMYRLNSSLLSYYISMHNFIWQKGIDTL